MGQRMVVSRHDKFYERAEHRWCKISEFGYFFYVYIHNFVVNVIFFCNVLVKFVGYCQRILKRKIGVERVRNFYIMHTIWYKRRKMASRLIKRALFAFM